MNKIRFLEKNKELKFFKKIVVFEKVILSIFLLIAFAGIMIFVEKDIKDYLLLGVLLTFDLLYLFTYGNDRKKILLIFHGICLFSYVLLHFFLEDFSGIVLKAFIFIFIFTILYVVVLDWAMTYQNEKDERSF